MAVSELCRNHLNLMFSEELIKRTSKDRNDVTTRNQIEPYALGNMRIQLVSSKDIDEFFTSLILV